MHARFRRPWQHERAGPLSVSLAAFLWAALLTLLLLGQRDAKEEGAAFSFSRFADAAVYLHHAGGSLPPWAARLLACDEEGLREERQKYYDAIVRDGAMPPEALPSWALAFAVLGDPDRARDALDRMEGAPAAGEGRHRLLSAVLSGEGPDGGLAAHSRERLAADPFNAGGRSDLPERHYLATVAGDEVEAARLREAGRRMMLRGAAAAGFCTAALLASVAGLLHFLLRRRRYPARRERFRIERAWRNRYALREFCYAELLAVGAALALMTTLAAAVGLAAALFPPALWAYDLQYLAMNAAFMSAPALWLWWRMAPGWRASLRVLEGRSPPWPPARLVAFGLAGSALLAGAAALSGLLDAPYGFLVDTIQAEALDRPFALAGTYLTAVVFAPVFEEVVFRGFLFGALRHRLGPAAAALLTSAAFAVMHGYSAGGLATVFLYGLVFCWLYHRSNSLFPGIFAHALLNLCVTLMITGWYSLH